MHTNLLTGSGRATRARERGAALITMLLVATLVLVAGGELII
jgi:Tfp pilus assembly protein PilX